MTRFTERKQRLDGTEHVFECELVDYSPRRAVCLFRSTGVFRTPHFTLDRGGLSYGVFWRNRPYILYRITNPAGTPVGYRFDVVDRVRIAPDGACYRDLVIDAWVDLEGNVILEDEDELAAEVAAGRVSEDKRREVDRVARLLLARAPRIVAEVERELASGLR